MPDILLILLLFISSIGPSRPSRVLAITGRGRHRQIRAIGTRRNFVQRLTKGRGHKDFVRCIPSDRALWDMDGVVYVSRVRRFWKSRKKLVALPRELFVSQGGASVDFLSWDSMGRLVSVPSATGLKVFDVTHDATMVAEILPPHGMAMIHPARLSPMGNLVAYGTVDASGQPYIVLEDIRTRSATAVGPLDSRPATVRAMELYWSPDSRFVAAAMDLSFPKTRFQRYFVVLRTDKPGVVRFKKSWKPYKFLGFSLKGHLVWWGAGRRSIYRLNLSSMRLKSVWRLYGRVPVFYSQAMDVLLANDDRGRCRIPRLVSYSPKRGAHTLMRWGKWGQLLAVDTTGWWGLFRAGGACRERRPSHYLMHLDGTLLIDELPRRRFRAISKAAPYEVTLCR